LFWDFTLMPSGILQVTLGQCLLSSLTKFLFCHMASFSPLPKWRKVEMSQPYSASIFQVHPLFHFMRFAFTVRFWSSAFKRWHFVGTLGDFILSENRETSIIGSTPQNHLLVVHTSEEWFLPLPGVTEALWPLVGLMVTFCLSPSSHRSMLSARGRVWLMKSFPVVCTWGGACY
jgi:hypothetical protein